MGIKERAYRCKSCGEVFIATSRRKHDFVCCPFCRGIGLEVLDAIGLDGLKCIAVNALKKARKEEIKKLKDILDVSYETGLSKQIEFKKCARRLNNLEATSNWIKFL